MMNAINLQSCQFEYKINHLMVTKHIESVVTHQNGTLMCLNLEQLNLINSTQAQHKFVTTIIDYISSYELGSSNKTEVVNCLNTFLFIYTDETNEAKLQSFSESLVQYIKDEAKQFKVYLYPRLFLMIYDDIEMSLEDVRFKIRSALLSLNKFHTKQITFYHHMYELKITLTDIMDAIDNDEFIMYYQPKIDAKTKDVVGVEALVRWFSSKYGYIAPDKYIGLLELYGQITLLGDYITEKVIREMKEIQQKCQMDLKVAINISRLQLVDVHFKDKLNKILSDNNFDEKDLILELTESIDQSQLPEVNRVIFELKSEGITISMDDFGKGFNTVVNLMENHYDEIKLDKSLTQLLLTKPDMIKSLIDMVKVIPAKVVAEGVETKAQFELLKELECDIIQGYYVAKPMPLNELETFLQ